MSDHTYNGWNNYIDALKGIKAALTQKKTFPADVEYARKIADAAIAQKLPDGFGNYVLTDDMVKLICRSLTHLAESKLCMVKVSEKDKYFALGVASSLTTGLAMKNGRTK